MCTVAGWGNLHEDGEDSLQLQQVDLPILASCEKETFFSDKEVLCAGYKEGQKDACQGDSGGPLMCTTPQGGWVQAGLVSFGRGCARPGNAGVYVRLSYHLDWIFAKLELMKDASNLPQESETIAECRGITCFLGEGACLPTQHVCDHQADCLEAEDEVSCGYEKDIVFETAESEPSYEAYKSSTFATTTTTTQKPETYYPDTSTITSTTTTTTPLPPTTTTDQPPSTTTTTIVNSAGAIETCVLFGIDEDNGTLSCVGDDFLCTRIPECLPRRNVCDGEPHCVDGTDELGCFCVDRLYSYGKDDFVCDGFYDCYDLSDEDCAPCGSQFVCALSQQCVPQEEVCDGKNNCRYGEDELFCIALINVHAPPERDRFGELTSQKEGRLVLRVEGVWDTICVDTLKQELGHRVCNFLGYETLDDLYYVEDSLYITPPSPQNHHTPRSKLAFTQVNNFNRTDRSHRVIRSTELQESFNATVEGSVATDISEEASVGVGGRKDVCRQVVFSCGEQKCGKVPLYFFTKVTPVWMYGGSPWAASVYVNGEYRCGGTLIHPLWLITSNSCMAGVSPEVESVWVVMGSMRRFGAPMRVWGAYEEGRQVGGAWLVGVSDILLLKLTKRMPKTNYISHLCLPTQKVSNLGPYSRCSMAGMSEEEDRESIGVPFSSTFNCPPHHICPDVKKDFKDICMESWAGVVACQLTQDNNPTWIGVGVWSYRRRAGNCNPALLHPLFTNEDLKEIHRILGYTNVVAVSSAVCEGRHCVPGVCVTPLQECDGRLECFDSSDESPACSAPTPRCRTYNYSENCECPRGWWTCLDNVCIPASALCDGVRDCANGEDELDCSCCKVLLFWSPEKRCDGQIDCADQSDEAFCGCQNDSQIFRCYSSKPLKCVSKERVCDETRDCPEGEDEAFCVTLVPHLRLEEDVLGNPKSYPSGFLMIRVSGKWFTYDYALWKSYLSHLICLQLGFSQAEETSVKFLSNDHVRRARGEAHGRERNEKVEHEPRHEKSLMKVVWIQCLTS
ncbi:hypothetical protein O3P69_016598 [Scylla paramamosain]|uniref:Uncharacterized protein n=1 Tax=Scylla paramamosain TaxID=85552 RepID=A0AAW0SZ95_SCYPA